MQLKSFDSNIPIHRNMFEAIDMCSTCLSCRDSGEPYPDVHISGAW